MSYSMLQVAPGNYSAIGVAKYIVWYCLEHGEHISNIKLQKLLYFVYGFFLYKTGLRLFPETFEAWIDGPGNRESYIELCQLGGESLSLLEDTSGVAELKPRHKEIVDATLDEYMKEAPFGLIVDTQKKGFAWSKAMNEHDNQIYPTMSLKDIEDEFVIRAKQKEGDEEPDVSGIVLNKEEPCYKHVVRVRPMVGHYYGGGVKYSCPVCAAVGDLHQVPYLEDSAPICEVNLAWDDVTGGESEDYEGEFATRAEQKEGKKHALVPQTLVPESLTWCRKHYVAPNRKFINCKAFGCMDATNGDCWRCMEMTPYQWHMCSDESWVRGLLSPTARGRQKSRAEAVKFIEQYKQRTPMGNERRALPGEKE